MSKEEIEIKILKMQLEKKTEEYDEVLKDALVLEDLTVWLKKRVDNIKSNNDYDRFEKLLCMDVLSKIKRLKEKRKWMN